MTMPAMDFLLNNVVRSFEAYEPDDIEFSVLLSLLLFDPSKLYNDFHYKNIFISSAKYAKLCLYFEDYY
jgi:hypothetical protein